MRDITQSLACPYTAVAYVTDYCGSGTDGGLFVYGISTGTTPSLTKEDELTLPTGCKPSTVTWHEPTGKLFVLCQTGESIIPVSLTNPCTLDAMETEEDLGYVSAISAAPSCTSSPSLASCGGNAVNCTPHDFAWTDSPAYMEDWLLVTLDGASQVIAVNANSPSLQAGFHGKVSPMSPYEPREVELVSY